MIALISAAVLALVLAGSKYVDARASGSPLGPAQSGVVHACRDIAKRAIAQHTALTVYCPPLVPHARGIRREYAGGLGGLRDLAAGYQISFLSLAVGGADGWGGHWTFAAGRPTAIARYLPLSVPPDTRIPLRRREVAAYSIPQDLRSFYAGHRVYVWRESNVAFHLTVHGLQWNARLRRMAIALMAALDDCRARPARPSCASVVIPAHR